MSSSILAQSLQIQDFARPCRLALLSHRGAPLGNCTKIEEILRKCHPLFSPTASLILSWYWECRSFFGGLLGVCRRTNSCNTSAQLSLTLLRSAEYYQRPKSYLHWAHVKSGCPTNSYSYQSSAPGADQTPGRRIACWLCRFDRRRWLVGRLRTVRLRLKSWQWGGSGRGRRGLWMSSLVGRLLSLAKWTVQLAFWSDLTQPVSSFASYQSTLVRSSSTLSHWTTRVWKSSAVLGRAASTQLRSSCSCTTSHQRIFYQWTGANRPH